MDLVDFKNTPIGAIHPRPEGLGFLASKDKVEFLHKAKDKGFRTYLYFVATEDPAINISRVRHRVQMGGHPVPEDKIITRYERSLDLLMEAVQFTNRAYIFDNSNENPIWLAEVTDGKILTLKTSRIPEWFKHALLDKINPSP
jgi:predicted ABC-type ATPase